MISYIARRLFPAVVVFSALGLLDSATYAGPGDPLKGIGVGVIKKPTGLVQVQQDLVPPPGEWYVGSSRVEWYPPGKAIRENGVQLTVLQGTSPVLLPGGDWAVDSFFDITFEIFLEVDGGPVTEYTGTGSMHIAGTAPGGQEPRVFDMEVLSLQMNGMLDPATPFEIRESPTLPSPGQTTLTLLPNGDYQIDSFFDVFTELSLDGGQTWAPGVGVPEPTTGLLLGLAVGAWAAGRRLRL